MPRYIVIGGSSIDHIVLPDGQKLPPQFGGNSIYAAMGIRVWSQDVGIVSVVGANFPKEWIDAVTAAEIDTSGIRRRAFPMGIEARIIYNPDGTRTLAPPAGILGVAQRLFPKPFLALGRRLWRTFNPRPSDIPEAFYDAAGAHIAPMPIGRQDDCLRALHGRIKTITLDPPPILPGDQVRGKKPDMPDLSLASVILPSEQEIAEYFGPVSAEQGARFLASGGSTVVVKLGERGSLIHEPRSQSWWQVPIYPTEVRDVTGAGDAYCGGYLVGLDETGNSVQAALYGAVSASFIIEGYGALFSLKYTREDAGARLAKMRSQLKCTDT